MQGPLALANIALPWLIFVQRRKWLRRLDENFDVTTLSDAPFSAFPTWLLVESPTRSQSHILFIARYSTDVTISRRFLGFCAAFLL